MFTANGKATELSGVLSVADYLKQHEYQANRIVVELNGEILPKDTYSTTFLKDNDCLEIVSFVGGGQ